MRMNSQPKLGILGGIGPISTAYLYVALVTGLQKRGYGTDNTTYPQIIVNSIPAPELVGTRVDKEQRRPYALGLKQLDAMGVDHITMACNTIHCYLDELREHVSAPIVDLPAAVEGELRSIGSTRPGLLGTAMTVQSGLYRFEGMQPVEPSAEDLGVLGEVIVAYNAGQCGPLHQAGFVRVVDGLRERGADSMVFGCTELAMLGRDLMRDRVPKVDTLDVLAEATLRDMGYASSPAS